jgi:hypothetical protein
MPMMPMTPTIPEAGSKVSTPEDRVCDHSQQQHYRDRGAHPTASSLGADTSASALGPYGMS